MKNLVYPRECKFCDPWVQRSGFWEDVPCFLPVCRAIIFYAELCRLKAWQILIEPSKFSINQNLGIAIIGKKKIYF